MVHLFTNINILHTVFYATLTFFISPYILVQKTSVINIDLVNDPCQAAFIVGFVISLILWNLVTKKLVY